MQRESKIDKLTSAEQRATIYKKNYLLNLYQYLIYNTHNWSDIDFPKNFNPTGKDSAMMEPYLNFVAGSSDFEQFRILDMQGMEMLRYERAPDGEMRPGLLQDKSGRTYFKEGLKLNKGDLYISDVNLNREFGKLEYPFKPVVRGIAPIFNENSEKEGLVVINFKMSRILDELQQTVRNSHFYLIDSEFNIIASSTGHKPVSYQMPPDSLKMDPKFSLLQNKYSHKLKDTAFYEDGHLFAMQTLDLARDFHEAPKSYYIVDRLVASSKYALVHHLTPQMINAELDEVFSAYFLINFFAVLMLGSVSYLLVRRRAMEENFYKQIEQKNRDLVQSNQLVAQSNKDLSQVNGVLQMRNQQLKEFNYLVSHNLRAPVTSMSVLVDMLKESQDEAEVKALVPKLVKVSSNIISLTEDITQYVSILNADRIELETINLKTMIEEVKNDFVETLTDTSFEIRYEMEAWSTIGFSKFYMSSILRNFISNAVKYSNPECASYLLFQAAYEEDRKVLYVRDNGLGIDMEKNRHNLFKLYKRFHRGFSGKGIGLFLIKSHLNALGAEITVTSEVNKGTSFKIIFK